MSAEATGWVFRYSPYSGATFRVHLAVADSVNDQHHNELWIAQGRLADKARCSRRHVLETALPTLVADSFLELLEDNVGKPNRYRFLFPDVPVVYETRHPRSRPQGVTSGDTTVPADLSPTMTGVSPQVTAGVTSGDTEPKKPKREPKASPSTPSEPWGTTADGAGEEEVLLEPLYKTLGGIRFELLDRLRHDPARTELAGALRTLRDAGWSPSAATARLTADPLDDARSIARVLTARARDLATLDPVTTPHTGPPACPDCAGRGYLIPDGAGVRAVTACRCLDDRITA